MNELQERYKKLDKTFSDDVQARPCLRVNTLKIKPKELIERLTNNGIKLTKVPFLKNGYWYESTFSLGATPEYLQGFYYLQEAASQLSAEILQPQPEEDVLDMASAPGGKTTHLAQIMKNKGSIIALDNNPRRLSAVANNIERLGVTNAILYKKDARFAVDLGKTFDKILLDAPCSSNFVVEPNFYNKHSLKTIKQIAKTQKELLRSAVKCLKPGGHLLYSTCSLEPEENELNINWLLNKYEDLELLDIDNDAGNPGIIQIPDQEVDVEIRKTRRLWPHKTQTQGFFIALIRKKE